MRMCGAVAVCGLVLFLTEVTMSADEAKDVAFPELPKGAGKLDKDAPKKFTETKSGLQYRVLRKGDGAMPKASNTVKVNYHGWLDNGKVFDSSYKRNEAISFPLNRVIPGWTEGMQLVGKGGMIELQIPSGLGYGDRGAPPDIPPKATLHFLVELLEVK
ncbi:MAG: FKBP-type peptidyl-prolyl cis-trans isomerase [Planctomycetales bacterium]|nr:FKBP-type peptidyl-prolyl cis-trans isomerase [Planctomycetales bacterium]